MKKNWWTGEDSNLRSSQGAADLQSAAINHSATCPKTTGPVIRKRGGRRARDTTWCVLNRTEAGNAISSGVRAATNRGPTNWSWRRDSNPRPSDYKSDALPAELRQSRLRQRGTVPKASRRPGQSLKVSTTELRVQAATYVVSASREMGASPAGLRRRQPSISSDWFEIRRPRKRGANAAPVDILNKSG